MKLLHCSLLSKCTLFFTLSIVCLTFFVSPSNAYILEDGELKNDYGFTSDMVTTFNDNVYFFAQKPIGHIYQTDLLRINTSEKVFESIMTLRESPYMHTETHSIIYGDKLYIIELVKKHGTRYIKTFTVDNDSNTETILTETALPEFGHRRIGTTAVYKDELYLFITPPGNYYKDLNKLGKDSYIYRFNGENWELAHTFKKESIVTAGVIGGRIYLYNVGKGEKSIYYSEDGTNYETTQSHIVNRLWEKTSFLGQDYLVNTRGYLAKFEDGAQHVVFRKKNKLKHPVVSNNSILAFQLPNINHVAITENTTDFYDVDFTNTTPDGEEWNFYAMENYGEAVGFRVLKESTEGINYSVLLTIDGFVWYEIPASPIVPNLYVKEDTIIDYSNESWSLLSDVTIVQPNIEQISQ